LLRNREFTALLSAQVVSGLGDQIARIAVALAVFERSESAFWAAAAFAVSYVPGIFGGTILGPLADRIPRRTLLLLCDVARAAVILLLAALNPTESPLWVAFLLLFIAESFTPVYDAAWASMIPEVLPDPHEYMKGSALLRVTHLLQQVAGLLLGGAAVAFVSVPYALMLDAATFLLSYVLILLWVHRRPAAIAGLSGLRALMRDVTEGARDLFSDPVRRALVIVAWMSCVYMITPMAVALPYAEQVGREATVGSLLMAATLAGTALGSALVARARPQRQVDAILPMAAGSSLVLVVVFLTPPLWIAVALWFVSGALAGFLVPLIGSVALFTDNARRGRAMGLAAAGYNILVAVAYLGGGWLADVTTPSTTVAGAGVLGIVLTALAWAMWPKAAIRQGVAETYTSGIYGPPGEPATPTSP
jgi:MFS family permease